MAPKKPALKTSAVKPASSTPSNRGGQMSARTKAKQKKPKKAKPEMDAVVEGEAEDISMAAEVEPIAEAVTEAIEPITPTKVEPAAAASFVTTVAPKEPAAAPTAAPAATDPIKDKTTTTTVKPYGAFLSHYKLEASMEARFLQNELENALDGRRVFLDSDDLHDLGRLREAVL